MKDLAAAGPHLEASPRRSPDLPGKGAASPTLLGVEGNLARWCFSLLVFTAFIGFTPAIIFGDTGAEAAMSAGGDVVRQGSFALLFILILLTATKANGAAFLLNVPTALVVLLLWCWASVAWAIDPSTSLRRVVFTTIVVLSVTYATGMLRYQAVLSLLCAWFAAILLADWLVMPFFAQAVHATDELDVALIGKWRGIHVHKNEAGAFCAIAALVFIHVTVKSRSFIVGPALVLLSLAFLYMTASKTSGGFVFVAVAAACAVECAYRNPTIRNVALFILPSAALIGYVVLESQIGALLLKFEDPAALTGRSQIWPVLLQYSSDHLLLGSGYGSFWAIGDASPIFDSGTEWLATITHAHNGYLDVLVQVGLIGASIAVIGLIVHPLYVLLTRELRAPTSRWLLCAVLIFCWLHNLLETSLLDRANIVWVTMLICYGLLRTPTGPTVADPRPPAGA